MWETGVQSLGWEDPLEKGKTTHSSILPGEFHVHGVTKSQTQLKRLSSSSSSSIQCFPGSSAGKESTCNAGDPSSIPGSGRSPGEGKSYQLQYSWTSLVAQLVKNLPAMWETWVGNLGWIPGLGKFPREGKGYLLQYSVLENSMDCVVRRAVKSQTRLSDFHFL